MEPSEILITTIARESDANDDDTFCYRSCFYKKLIDWKDFDKILCKFFDAGEIYFSKFYFADSSKNTGFFIKLQIINDQKFLVICHQNQNIVNPNVHERKDKIFFVESFFEKFYGTDFGVSELAPESNAATEGKELYLVDFYERLRQAHENDDLETDLPADVQHPALRPILRPYQKKGIKWMLKRELIKESPPSYHIKMRSKFNKDLIVYFNKYTQTLDLNDPEQEKIPAGGLLTGKKKIEMFKVET